MFLFFVGCDGGPGGGGGSEEGNPQSIAGAKILSKPSDYSFSDAVGEYATEYYYNLFASEILKRLYHIYEENRGIIQEDGEDNFYFLSSNSDILQEVTDLRNGQFYLNDSLRYSIEQIATTRDKTSGAIVEQQLVLNLNSAWNWSLGYNQSELSGSQIVFILNSLNEGDILKDKVEIDSNTQNNLVHIKFTNDYFVSYGSWLEYYEILPSEKYPSFQQIYTPDESVSVTRPDGNSKNLYNKSPYIQSQVIGEEVDTLNYYQDALEYAIYLFVLGYDYVDADGKPTDDAPLFDFVIDYSKLPSDKENAVKVNGWENQPISIVDALGRVKALYNEMGGYVGVTPTNKNQIVRFILDKVIGQNAISKDTLSIQRVNNLFTPSESGDGSGVTEPDIGNVEEPLVFNRHYEKIVEAVVDYSCSQAPIGWDIDANDAINLDQPYLASQITDYKDDYFFLSYENDDDSNLFQYIEAAEYQSMIIYPTDEFMGKQLTDIIMAFEYFDNPVEGMKMADSLLINVGFRYFSASANGGKGEIISTGEVQKEIKFGKNGYIDDENPDCNWVYIGNSEKEQSQYDIAVDSNVIVNTMFNNNIGNGAINPFAGDTTIDGKKSKLISGNDDARKYYKLNDSSSYGVYGTLNEDMFSVENAGEEACDFIEIYFDTVKQKGVSGINYNFKVGLFWVSIGEDV